MGWICYIYLLFTFTVTVTLNFWVQVNDLLTHGSLPRQKDPSAIFILIMLPKGIGHHYLPMRLCSCLIILLNIDSIDRLHMFSLMIYFDEIVIIIIICFVLLTFHVNI